ncbi:MAG: hypothetical protein A3C06_00415 [Candidatus Taylorbacteria bacterium RIFCSPHIGHO2_02_FULL_46_13]|uniref:Uncharacterized protein n=1 Tax=Candidatus Taylorbacteria bacterium RIFCSPHIGHO2_02_FULL_46_13 TaxID=1802312 RepID=A0A1G2MPW9_9BACT|nr:MAG: hypothetical protein A3C06_00415 [Candidatus Taylorbacteria bacterium RIFCSPHIGHO2_02_FULL_46_13]
MKKRYWLRGGITGLVISIIFLIYFNLISQCIGDCPDFKLDFKFQDIWIALAVMYGGTTVGSFIGGSIIGWLYGKIKNRKKP